MSADEIPELDERRRRSASSAISGCSAEHRLLCADARDAREL